MQLLATLLGFIQQAVLHGFDHAIDNKQLWLEGTVKEGVGCGAEDRQERRARLWERLGHETQHLTRTIPLPGHIKKDAGIRR